MVVMHIINQIRSGRILDEKLEKDPYTIAIRSIQNRTSKWDKIIKSLNKKEEGDFFLKYVRNETPDEYVKGIKNKKD